MAPSIHQNWPQQVPNFTAYDAQPQHSSAHQASFPQASGPFPQMTQSPAYHTRQGNDDHPMQSAARYNPQPNQQFLLPNPSTPASTVTHNSVNALPPHYPLRTHAMMTPAPAAYGQYPPPHQPQGRCTSNIASCATLLRQYSVVAPNHAPLPPNYAPLPPSSNLAFQIIVRCLRSYFLQFELTRSPSSPGSPTRPLPTWVSAG